LSFSRRRSQQKEAAPVAREDTTNPPTPAIDEAAPTKSTLNKVIRSVSFSRTTRKPPPKKEETASDDSSESRPPTPDDPLEDTALAAASETVVAPATSNILEVSQADIDAVSLSSSLHGWLKKRHQRHPGTWAKRYFDVNDSRGTVAYSKGEKGKKTKPSVVLSLQDISAVGLSKEWSNAFVIYCTPIVLTLAADDKEEAHMWVLQLNKRMQLWREKAKSRTMVAQVRPAASPVAEKPKPAVSGVSRGELEPRPPVAESSCRIERCPVLIRQHPSVPASHADEYTSVDSSAPFATAGTSSLPWPQNQRIPSHPGATHMKFPALASGLGGYTHENEIQGTSVEAIQAFDSD